MLVRILIIIFITNLCFAGSLKNITAQEYYLQNPSEERKLILNFILNQFQGKKVSQADLNNLWKNDKLKKDQKLMRFQIVNQSLYTDSFHLNSLYYISLVKYFSDLIKKYKMPDVDFIIYGRDEIIPLKVEEELALQIPAFMMSKNTDSLCENNKFLMPDALIASKKWKSIINRVSVAKDNYPWDNKIEKIFWRGASTGSKSINFYNVSNIDKLIRLKLVFLSKLFPDKIDAVITKFPEFSSGYDGKKLLSIMKILYKNADPVSEEEHLKYKYLIAVDGNTSPWVRVPWILSSNSVLLRQETSNIQWFYPALKPYIHYIPLKKDLTDIFEKFDWLKNNDQKLKHITYNAQKFIQNNLMPEDIEAHMVISLNEYSKIQQDKKIASTLPTSEKVFSLTRLLRELMMYLWRK